jgi:hypothetical protein
MFVTIVGFIAWSSIILRKMERIHSYPLVCILCSAWCFHSNIQHRQSTFSDDCTASHNIQRDPGCYSCSRGNKKLCESSSQKMSGERLARPGSDGGMLQMLVRKVASAATMDRSWVYD